MNYQNVLKILNKIEKKHFFSFLTLLFILCLLFAYVGNENNYFIGNIIPELIGVCIELFIFMLIFDQWRLRESKNNKIKVERRLREFLIFFLDKACDGLSENLKVGRFYGSDYTENQKMLDNFIQHIEQQGLNENVILQVKKYCDNQKDVFNNLISVSAELENEHFKSWARISYFINAISTNEEKTSVAMIEILKNIRRFDKTSHDSELYVGAK
ncbi:hypothetical protein LZ636_16915 [Proteus terrae]|uniref:hypothetical protein n=1 Tax=Proteus terrae TaxID=1574161 RepID=UPI001F41B7AD|nr:hypothetical protein [Proteus terrae]MCE9841354.1 hypothetical protein [Proteus terrae]